MVVHALRRAGTHIYSETHTRADGCTLSQLCSGHPMELLLSPACCFWRSNLALTRNLTWPPQSFSRGGKGTEEDIWCWWCAGHGQGVAEWVRIQVQCLCSPGRAAKHGCSDLVICGQKTFYLSKGSPFLILIEVQHGQPLCFVSVCF